MRTLTTKEYELISKIYNSTDEIEANVAFEFGLQNDLYYQLFHSYEDKKLMRTFFISRLLQYDQR